MYNMSHAMHIPNIVIVGGGAGGLELATRLGNTLGRQGSAKITLIDCFLTHVWKPLLHEIAAGTLYAQDTEVDFIAHARQHHFHFQLGALKQIDRTNKTIQVASVRDDKDEVIIPERTLPYDYLVLAVGSISNDFSIPGVIENCFFLDNHEQAEAFHKMLLCRWLELTYRSADEKQLHIVIVGGGATGVELAAELRGMIQKILRYSDEPKRDTDKEINISILEAAPRLVPMLPESLSNKVAKVLKNMNVNVYTNEAVKQVEKNNVLTKSGMNLPADITVWAAGIKAPNLLKELDGLETNQRGQLRVKQTLQTTRDENIFAIGDCAACPLDEKNFVPPRAQVAHQEAELLATSLIRKIQGKSLLEFHFRDYGSLLSISNNAVGNLMGILARDWMLEGKLAKWVYLSLYQKHLMALHGFWRTTYKTLSNLFSRKVKPKLKLH